MATKARERESSVEALTGSDSICHGGSDLRAPHAGQVPDKEFLSLLRTDGVKRETISGVQMSKKKNLTQTLTVFKAPYYELIKSDVTVPHDFPAQPVKPLSPDSNVQVRTEAVRQKGT